jgi:hypothetical protein
MQAQRFEMKGVRLVDIGVIDGLFLLFFYQEHTYA